LELPNTYYQELQALYTGKRATFLRYLDAADLHYTGDTNDSATMNVWLHKEVMKKLAENGGRVPPELLSR